MHRTFDELNFLGSGLKCQECGEDGVCNNNDDNGQSIECPTGLDSCWYIHDSKGSNYWGCILENLSWIFS